MRTRHVYSTILIFVFFTANAFTQIYNTDVEAKIEVVGDEENIQITGTAYNKSQVTQNIRYELSVIRSNPENTNQSKNSQNGREVLQSMQKKELSATTINITEKDQIILLLLIYDSNDNIIGKDRVAFNETENTTEVLENLNETLEETTYQDDLGTESYDGITLSGIVIEETKTKAGRDFYQMFYSTYLSNKINAKQIVTIHEALTMGNNTKIQIKVADEVVFEFFVRPLNDYLKSMADVSIRRVTMHFERLNREASLIKRY